MIRLDELKQYKNSDNFFVVVEPEDHIEFLQLCRDIKLKQWGEDEIVNPDKIIETVLKNEQITGYKSKKYFIEIEPNNGILHYLSPANVSKLSSMPHYLFSELKDGKIVSYYHSETIDEKNDKYLLFINN